MGQQGVAPQASGVMSDIFHFIFVVFRALSKKKIKRYNFYKVISFDLLLEETLKNPQKLKVEKIITHSPTRLRTTKLLNVWHIFPNLLPKLDKWACSKWIIEKDLTQYTDNRKTKERTKWDEIGRLLHEVVHSPNYLVLLQSFVHGFS